LTQKEKEVLEKKASARECGITKIIYIKRFIKLQQSQNIK
jgi:hypothetical protein